MITPYVKGQLTPDPARRPGVLLPRMDRSFTDRIRERLAATGKSVRKASLDAGLSETALKDILANEKSFPKLDTLAKLAGALDVDPAWLAFGTDGVSLGWPPKNDNPRPARKGAKAGPAAGEPIEVPIIGPVEAGAWREAPQYELQEIEYVSTTRDPEFPWAKHIAFRVFGDSMNATKPVPILPGCRLICLDWHSIDSKIILRDELLLVVEQTRDNWQTREWTVKELAVFEDRYELQPRSTNPRYQPISVPITVFKDPSEEDARTVRILALVREISYRV